MQQCNRRHGRINTHRWSWKYEKLTISELMLAFLEHFNQHSKFHVCITLFTEHTYLVGHNNLINEFQPAATHPLGASASCAPTPVGFTNQWQSFLHLVLPTDFRKYPSRRSILHTNDMAEPAQPLNINTLHNVHVVEELIQLTIESNAEIIANSHWTEDLTWDFSLEYSQGCCISA